jgi:methyl-accepting chemotaxis protein
MEQAKNRYKRRNYFINREMQGKLIFYYFMLAFLTVLLFMATSTLIASGQLSIVYDNYRIVVEKSTCTIIRDMLKANWIVMLTGGLLLSIAVMFISHRIAGPLYRFGKTLDAMLDRDLSQDIWLRQKDEGKPIARQLNRFNMMLSEDLAAMENLCDAMEAELDACPEPQRAKLSERLSALRDRIAAYKRMSRK